MTDVTVETRIAGQIDSNPNVQCNRRVCPSSVSYARGWAGTVRWRDILLAYVCSVSNSAPTSERVLEAAIDAIEAGGEASLRLDAVARAAGITKPSIYYFFGDREGLVAAAQAERYRRSLLQGLVDAIELTRRAASREEFESLLPIFVDMVMDPMSAHRRGQRMQVLGSAVSRPKLTEEVVAATERARELTTELVRLPFDRGWATSAFEPDVIAMWWLSNTQGRHLFDLLGDEQMHEQWRAVTIAQLRLLFFGSGETPVRAEVFE